MGRCLPPGRHLSLRCGHCRGYSGSPRCTSSTSCRTCRSSMCLCRSLGGDQVGGTLAEDRCAGACRAGYRCAQDLSGPNPTAFCGSSSAEGRTVGESTHDRVFLFLTAADCRADHRHSSSRSWRYWWTGSRIQQHGLWTRTLTFQFPGGGLHVLPDPGGSSSSAVSRDERGEVFFFFSHFSPSSKKVRSPPQVRVRGCPPGRAHELWRLMRGCKPRTSILSTTAPCGSRLGTGSTSVTAGASSTPTTAFDAPVPLVEQLVEVLKIAVTLVPDVEQVIEVPKIALEDPVARPAPRAAGGGAARGCASAADGHPCAWQGRTWHQMVAPGGGNKFAGP